MISIQNLSVEFSCKPLFDNINFVRNSDIKAPKSTQGFLKLLTESFARRFVKSIGSVKAAYFEQLPVNDRTHRVTERISAKSVDKSFCFF